MPTQAVIRGERAGGGDGGRAYRRQIRSGRPSNKILSGPPEPLYTGHHPRDGRRTFPVRQSSGGTRWREEAKGDGSLTASERHRLTARRKEPPRGASLEQNDDRNERATIIPMY